MTKEHRFNYYSTIIHLAKGLECVLKDEMDESIQNARFEEEEDYLTKFYDKQVKVINKIQHESSLLLFLDGNKPKKDKESYKDSNLFTISTAQDTYQFSSGQIKNVLGQDYERIMNYIYAGNESNVLKDVPKEVLVPQKQKPNKKNKKKPINPEPVKNTTNSQKKQSDKIKMKSSLDSTRIENKVLGVKKVVEPEILSSMFDEFEDLLLQDDLDDLDVTVKKDNLDNDNKISVHKKEDAKKTKNDIDSFMSIDTSTESMPVKENPIYPIKKEMLNKPFEKVEPSRNNKIENRITDVDELVVIDTIKDELEEIKAVDVNIKKEDLLIDNYLISLRDSPGNLIKQVSILVTPLYLFNSSSFAVPIMVIAKSGQEIKSYVSENPLRPSIPVMIDNDMFVIRGSWNDIDFQTLIYPQNNNGYEITKEVKVIRPQNIKNAGHQIMHVNGDVIHIFPLSSKNNDAGYVKSFICIENISKKSYQIEIMSHNKYTIGNYEISAFWESNELVTVIMAI